MLGFDAPLEGLRASTGQLDRAATRIARAVAPPEPPGDTVDLSAELVALMLARNSVAANVKVAQTAGETSRTLLDVLG